jgi:hypothetical protein
MTKATPCSAWRKAVSGVLLSTTQRNVNMSSHHRRLNSGMFWRLFADWRVLPSTQLLPDLWLPRVTNIVPPRRKPRSVKASAGSGILPIDLPTHQPCIRCGLWLAEAWLISDHIVSSQIDFLPRRGRAGRGADRHTKRLLRPARPDCRYRFQRGPGCGLRDA